MTIKLEPRDLSPNHDDPSPLIIAEAASLKLQIGDITSSEQIMRATDYIDHLTVEARDDFKFEAWNLHLLTENIDDTRLWREIHIYRLMGEVSSSILPPVENKAEMLDEFLMLVQRWTSLAADGALGDLEEEASVKGVGIPRAGAVESLKAFLVRYQQQNGFEEWTRVHMDKARLVVLDVWKEHNQGKQQHGGHQQKRPIPVNGSFSCYLTVLLLTNF